MISLEDGKTLLNLAKKAVFSRLENKNLEIEENIKKRFAEKQGCFVTLHKDGSLRGCIGFPEPVLPLYKAIAEAAVSAGFSDPRFPPLQKAELNSVIFEISILTKPELIKVNTSEEYFKKIEIGRDGLVIRGIYSSGLLLPQVFPEWHANEKTALEMTCQKAGLNKDAWKDLNNKIYKFQAQIFKENKHNGRIVEANE